MTNVQLYRRGGPDAGIHDILRHVLDAVLNNVVGRTDLIQVLGTSIVQVKLSRFKHAEFDESLSNTMVCGFFCSAI